MNGRSAWLFLALVAITARVEAAGRMVYMWEKGNEKQIYLANSDGTRPSPITSGSRWHLYPEIDGSGSRVLYVEGKDEKRLDVVLKDLKTGKAETLTSGEGIHLHPDFSGNGNFIAFSAQYGEGSLSQIQVWELGIDGLTPKADSRWLVESEFNSYFPSLSHDGKHVVFQRTKSKTNKDVVLYSLETKTLTQITPADGNAMAPSLSADDRYIVFTQLVSGNWDVYVHDRNTREERRLTFESKFDFAPTFRPDGSIVFASNRGGTFELYEIASNWRTVKTPQARKLVASEADLYAPSVSVNGDAILSEMAPIPDPARSSFGAVKVLDSIAVVGGHQGKEHTYPPESFSNVVNLYNLKTGEWKTAAPRPRLAHGFSLASYGKYLYAFGGFAYSETHKPKWRSLTEIDRYDIETDTWTTVGSLPRRRSSNVVAQLGTMVYLIGGWDSTPKFDKDYDGVFHREIDVFDLATEKTSVSAHALPDPLRRAFTGVVVGGEILLVGGLGQGATHFELLDRVTAFNPATGGFRELPKLPFATFAPAAGVIGDRLFVFGGMFKIGEKDYTYVDSIYAHQMGASGWFDTRLHLKEQKGFSQVVEVDGGLAILGGHTYVGDEDHPVKTFELLSAP